MTVLVNKGKEAVRDFLITHLIEGATGTDGTATTVTMNELGNEIVRKSSDNLKGSFAGISRHRVRILTTEANGETLREVGLFNDDGDMVIRTTHTPVTKNDTFEILYDIKIEVKN